MKPWCFTSELLIQFTPIICIVYVENDWDGEVDCPDGLVVSFRKKRLQQLLKD